MEAQEMESAAQVEFEQNHFTYVEIGTELILHVIFEL
jgi:hypothetical protein